MEKCLRCEGKGYIWVMIGEEPEKDICPACAGDGYIGEEDSFEDDNACEVLEQAEQDKDPLDDAGEHNASMV